MKTRVSLALIILVLLATACAAAPAASVGSIQINSAWIKAASSSGNTAAFMVIKNTGSQPDRLVKGEFSSAKMVQLMTTAEKDGKMAMSMVDAIDIPAGGQVELKSGSFHVMLMGLTNELKAGDNANVTLTFEKAGPVTFALPVKGQ